MVDCHVALLARNDDDVYVRSITGLPRSPIGSLAMTKGDCPSLCSLAMTYGGLPLLNDKYKIIDASPFKAEWIHYSNYHNLQKC
jgi:hypothetical protein